MILCHTMAQGFEILSGLPGVGPFPVQFSATGQGTHREGFVVRFFPKNSEPWVGNFQPGATSFNRVLMHPDGRTVVVIAGGQVYHIDPDSRSLIDVMSSCVLDAAVSESRHLLALADYTSVSLLKADGQQFKTDPVAWDGISDLAFGDTKVFGLASDLSQDWNPFFVDIETGRISGGAFGYTSREVKFLSWIRSGYFRGTKMIILGVIVILLLLIVLVLARVFTP